MKMVKKILLGLALAGTVLALAGCNSPIENDNAQEDGDKYNKTITVDASETDPKYEADKDYKRAFVQLGKLEQVQSFSSVITFNKNEVSNGVVGLAFDLNYDKDETDKDIEDSYNFVLVGFNPYLKKYYIERYRNVSMNSNNGYTDVKALGNYISYKGSTWTSEYVLENDDFVSATKNTHYTEDEDGNITLKFTISQETDRKYEIKLGSAKIGEYERTDKSSKDNTKYVNVTKEGKAQGGIALYANAKNGLKFSVNCKTDKDTVVGKLYEEVEE